MNTTHRTEAIILLYPSKTQTTKELRNSVSDFCARNNITAIDVIHPTDEYDYFSMRRLAEVIKYRTEPLALITNKDILATVPVLTLWSIVDTPASSKVIDIMRSFLQELKENSRADDKSPEDFRVLNHKEVSHMSDWMNDMRCVVVKNNRANF